MDFHIVSGHRLENGFICGKMLRVLPDNLGHGIALFNRADFL